MIKILTITSISLIISFSCRAQFKNYDILNHIDKEEREKNTLYSIMNYDSLGNQFQVKKSYDHVPTLSDSLEFASSIRKHITKMINGFYEEEKRTHGSASEIKVKSNQKLKN